MIPCHAGVNSPAYTSRIHHRLEFAGPFGSTCNRRQRRPTSQSIKQVDQCAEWAPQTEAELAALRHGVTATARRATNADRRGC